MIFLVFTWWIISKFKKTRLIDSFHCKAIWKLSVQMVIEKYYGMDMGKFKWKIPIDRLLRIFSKYMRNLHVIVLPNTSWKFQVQSYSRPRRGCAPFGQHQKSPPLGQSRSQSLRVFWSAPRHKAKPKDTWAVGTSLLLRRSNFQSMRKEFVSYSQLIILSVLTLSMRRVMGSP